jgi:archaellum component FlaC
MNISDDQYRTELQKLRQQLGHLKNQLAERDSPIAASQTTDNSALFERSLEPLNRNLNEIKNQLQSQSPIDQSQIQTITDQINNVKTELEKKIDEKNPTLDTSKIERIINDLKTNIASLDANPKMGKLEQQMVAMEQNQNQSIEALKQSIADITSMINELPKSQLPQSTEDGPAPAKYDVKTSLCSQHLGNAKEQKCVTNYFGIQPPAGAKLMKGGAKYTHEQIQIHRNKAIELLTQNIDLLSQEEIEAMILEIEGLITIFNNILENDLVKTPKSDSVGELSPLRKRLDEYRLSPLHKTWAAKKEKEKKEKKFVSDLRSKSDSDFLPVVPMSGGRSRRSVRKRRKRRTRRAQVAPRK